MSSKNSDGPIGMAAPPSLDRSLSGQLAHELKILRASKTALDAKRRDVDFDCANVSFTGPRNRVGAAGQQIEEAKTRCHAVFAELGEKRDRAIEAFKLTQANHGAFRAAKEPDPMRTLVIAFAMVIAEGGIVSVFLAAEGTFTVPAALAMGVLLAFASVCTGIAIGYYPARFLNYGLGAAINDPKAQAYRRYARRGLIGGLVAQAALIWSGARLRATGDHASTFAFSEYGFFDTFNEGTSIVMIVLGVLFAGISIAKGYSGISDPVPEMTENWQAATRDVDGTAEDEADETIAVIQDAAEDTSDEIDEAIEEAEDAPSDLRAAVSDLSRAVDAHNEALDAAHARLKTAAVSARKTRDYVKGKPGSAKPPFDLTTLEALRAEPVGDAVFAAIPNHDEQIERLKTLGDDLDALAESAIADIRAGLSAFRAQTPSLDTLFDEGDADYEAL